MKEKLKYLLYFALFYPLAILPLCVLYRLSDFLYFILYKVLGYREKIVTQNLETSFPEKSPAEIKEIKKRFYRFLCDTIVETVKLLHISDKQIMKRVKVHGVELVNEAAAAGRPVILFLGHYGNWEWVPATTLYYTPEMISAHIYKAPHNPAFDRFMLRLRARFSSVGIPQEKAVRTILAMRREGKPFMVGFISDQRSNSEVSHQRVDFLNHLTPYNVGGETIGDKIGAEYLYLDITQPRRGYYDMTFRAMDPGNDSEPHPYTRLYMRMLEDTIRRQPWLWLWSHRRWLYK